MLRGLNHCRGQHAQAKECGGSNEHRPSANTIGNNAQEHRTKQHTNEPGAENGTESCRVDVPIMCQGGRDKSYGLDIEAIHDHHTPDQDHDPFLERTERTLIDQISDAHSRWIAGIRRSKGGGFRGHWTISVVDVTHGYLWIRRALFPVDPDRRQHRIVAI